MRSYEFIARDGVTKSWKDGSKEGLSYWMVRGGIL